jgi:Leucine-rich repeat (LRR) protein
MSAQLKGLLSLPQQATVTRSNQGYEAIVLTTVNTVVRKLTLNSNALASLGALHAHAPNLSYLSASGNALTTEGIREVHHLKQLVTLILSLNKLEKVPRSLSRLPRLQALILNGNAIRKLPTLEIPTLSALVLSHNELVSIPAGALAWLPSLTKLSLSHNKLAAFPDVSKNPMLRELRLNGNELEAVPAMQENEDLVLLDVGSNK